MSTEKKFRESRLAATRERVLARRMGDTFDANLSLVDMEVLLAEVDRLNAAERARVKDAQPRDFGLTPRLTCILAELAGGSTNADIADRLCLSEKTVKNYVTILLQELNLENRTQAAVAYVTRCAA